MIFDRFSSIGCIVINWFVRTIKSSIALISDFLDELVGQSKTKKLLSKEQQLTCENKQLKEELFILKNGNGFLPRNIRAISKNSDPT